METSIYLSGVSVYPCGCPGMFSEANTALQHAATFSLSVNMSTRGLAHVGMRQCSHKDY